MREAWVWALGQEDPLEKGMVTHSSIPAWRIPRTEEPCRLGSMVLQTVGQNWVTKHWMTDWLDNVKDDKADTLFSAHKRIQKLLFILKIKHFIVL